MWSQLAYQLLFSIPCHLARNGGNEPSPTSLSGLVSCLLGKDRDEFAGTFSSVPLPVTFPSVSYWSSNPGEDGQSDDRGMHQTSGTAHPSVTHVGTQVGPLEPRLFLPLRAAHAPGNLNRGVELLSRGVLIYEEWTPTRWLRSRYGLLTGEPQWIIARWFTLCETQMLPWA